MKCIKCGAELEEGSKYCSHCGTENANASVDDVKQNMIKRMWSKISLYNRMLIIFILMLGMLSCAARLFNNTLAFVISIIQIVLLILSMLMKKQIIKGKKGLHILLSIITVLLMIPYINSYRPDYGNAKEFEWDEIILHDAIPTPESLLGEIVYNSEEDFTVCIYKITANQFAEYVKKCKENGFTVDVEEWEYYFSAYNGLEYKLSLEFNEENGEMYINLELLEQYGVFEWVESDITKMLPIPKSNIGKIVENDTYLFKAYVARTTIQEYREYVKACQLKGFDVEVDNMEKTFIAKNSNGYKVLVSYEENNVISITLSEPEYNVEIKVKCEENWIFNTYDVKLYLNDSYKRTINHGETETYNFSLKQGVYIIKFASSEDEKIVGTVNVEIVQDEKYEFKISCGFEKIGIKTVKGKTFVSDEQEESKGNTIVNEDGVRMPEPSDDYSQKEQEQVKENEKIEETLTIDNCEELKTLLGKSNPTIEEWETFAKKYKGRVLEFDAVMDYSLAAEAGGSGELGVFFYAICNGERVYKPCFAITNANQYHNGLENFDFNERFGEERDVHAKLRIDYFDEGFGRCIVKAVQIDKR